MQAVCAIVAAVLGALVLLVSVPTPVAGTITTQHAPIFINGDNSFIPSNGVNGGGSGTADDPYIIENWAIDASDNHGIWIENTTRHFVIRNCVIENGGDAHWGVYLENVRNGKIENNSCENNLDGIFLGFSDNNVLSNNICENNFWGGVTMIFSTNNILNNNACPNNLVTGIYLYSSSHNGLVGNTCENNNYGIQLLSSSDYNSLRSNVCSNNAKEGICLSRSSFGNLVGNICENNYVGISLIYSSNDNLINNTSVRNSSGIYLESSDNSVLSNNTCENNWRGIRLWEATRCILSNNTCENNSYNFGVVGSNVSHYDHEIDTSNLVNGRPIRYIKNKSDLVIGLSLNAGYLALVGCDNIRVGNLVLENNGQGILFASTKNSRIENCTFSSNTEGISLCSSSYNKLVNNICDNNYYGIRLYSSSNYNSLHKNTCSNNVSDGICLSYLSSNTLSNNTCSNSICGIRLWEVSQNVLSNNICSNNSYGLRLFSATNNIIFHNYMSSNTLHNAYDDNTNRWDENGEGNYWGDWQPPDHPDADGDGIVDEPRPIAGGTNQDSYPLVLSPSLPPFNELPTADAGGPYSVDGGETVELDGTGSSDPDGTIVSYSWTITSDPTGEASLTETDNAISTFHAPFVESSASVTVSLIVEDNSGATDNTIATITIQPPSGETPYALYVEIIAIIIIVGLLAYFGIRRGVVQGCSSKMPGFRNKRLAKRF